jgi:hypothetical protein
LPTAAPVQTESTSSAWLACSVIRAAAIVCCAFLFACQFHGNDQNIGPWAVGKSNAGLTLRPFKVCPAAFATVKRETAADRLSALVTEKTSTARRNRALDVFEQ